MNALSFQDIVKIGSNHAIVLCRSTTDSGEMFFHYIKSDKKNIEQMHHDYNEKKEVDFSSYGEIIHSGWGKNPTKEDERVIHEKFPEEQ